MKILMTSRDISPWKSVGTYYVAQFLDRSRQAKTYWEAAAVRYKSEGAGGEEAFAVKLERELVSLGRTSGTEFENWLLEQIIDDVNWLELAEAWIDDAELPRQ